MTGTLCSASVGMVIPNVSSRSFRTHSTGFSGRNYPRPTNGIFVAMTVMNSTLASRGRLAI
jgi:hypothetical protein